MEYEGRCVFCLLLIGEPHPTILRQLGRPFLRVMFVMALGATPASYFLDIVSKLVALAPGALEHAGVTRRVKPGALVEHSYLGGEMPMYTALGILSDRSFASLLVQSYLA